MTEDKSPMTRQLSLQESIQRRRICQRELYNSLYDDQSVKECKISFTEGPLHPSCSSQAKKKEKKRAVIISFVEDNEAFKNTVFKTPEFSDL